jgi:Spy/CpxP family protein refolding chaperone
MKLEIKTVNKQLIWLSALSIASMAIGVKALEPAYAKNPAGTSLIDAEWENSLRTHFEKRLFHYIDASDEQEKKLDALFKGRLEETRPTREKLREGAVELTKMYADEEATDDQIEAKVKELRAMREQLAEGRLKTALQVRHILTAEQRNLIGNRIINRLSENEKHPFMKGL